MLAPSLPLSAWPHPRQRCRAPRPLLGRPPPLADPLSRLAGGCVAGGGGRSLAGAARHAQHFYPFLISFFNLFTISRVLALRSHTQSVLIFIFGIRLLSLSHATRRRNLLDQCLDTWQDRCGRAGPAPLAPAPSPSRPRGRLPAVALRASAKLLYPLDRRPAGRRRVTCGAAPARTLCCVTMHPVTARRAVCSPDRSATLAAVISLSDHRCGAPPPSPRPARALGQRGRSA